MQTVPVLGLATLQPLGHARLQAFPRGPVPRISVQLQKIRSRPVQLEAKKRGDANVARFLPKDRDNEKAAAEVQQQVPIPPPASVPAAAEGNNYSPEFVRRRLLVFVGIVIGYTTFYLTRGSLTYSAPAMVADSSLGFNLTHIGTMTSIFPMAYGVSKFAAGVLSTGVSPRLLLGLGLMATAAVNLAFGASSTMTVFCVLWGLNGMLQGVGAPACATILTRWFAAKERGTFWGMWNIAHNLGGFLAPVIVGGCAKAFGWRWGMWAPGLIGVVIGLFVLTAVRDKPTDLGYPAVDAPAAGAATAAAKPAEEKEEKGKGGSMMDYLGSVLKLPSIWALAFTYFFIYVVRQGVTSWLVFYLMAEKGAADAGSAALTVSGLELGGLAGSTVAGFLSDKAIRGAKQGVGLVGKRIQVCGRLFAGITSTYQASICKQHTSICRCCWVACPAAPWQN
eukprot:GHRR01013810.1.p1 GENE.GHRR01013810.1~~GHRR01013810.1.p1  ORF type:complete len:450 (+),score=159.08 GHRR01013810.1:172-1521(+)